MRSKCEWVLVDRMDLLIKNKDKLGIISQLKTLLFAYGLSGQILMQAFPR